MTRNKFISVIDDDPDIVLLFYEALRSMGGFTIFKFTDPKVALQHIKINRDAYVLIISDLRMPDINGLELIKSTKDLNRNIRTILMTAFDIDDRLFQEYMKSEIINGFLQKPVEIKELYSEVNRQIGRHKK